MSEYGAAEEISKLADLKDRGLISEAEFEDQRQRVLDPTGIHRKTGVRGIAVFGAVIAVVALSVGLLTASHPSEKSTNTNVHLSLASETSAESAAVGWAKTFIGSSKYNEECLGFVINAYQLGAGFPIRSHVTISIGSDTYPSQVWGHFIGGTTGGPTTTAPAGALFFWNNTGGYTLSHVAISVGGGEFISTSDHYASGVHYQTMAEFNQNSWARPLGWWLPDGSSAPPPSVASPPPAPSPTPSTGSGAQVAGPSALQPAAGGATLQPAEGAGALQPAAGSSTLNNAGSVSSSSASASSTAPSSTPPPAATTTPTVASPPLPPPPAPATYAETVGGVSHSWTDYSNAGGTEGPSIAAYQTVEIACKVTGFQVADGNTWWYRIASSPWNDQYYVSADAFYNNGETSGSLHGTPFVDPAVPNC